ncbi:MAG TPA: HAMP domain-containing sensor histidine kinase [Actinomycetota bacterium]|nr:HAMP domain-containing sensor histidine kinase [Actinomycetota bacterium]
MRGRPIRALIVAEPDDARAQMREALQGLSIEVVGETLDLKAAAFEAGRTHPDLVILAVSPTDEEPWSLGPMLGAAPGARVIVTLLEEWSERAPVRGYDLRQVIETLRAIRAADDSGPSSKRKEGTLSMLAHDILTPTTAIVGLADLLLRYWERFDAEERQRGVANIAEVGRDLAALVKGVVRAAAADAGALIGDREPVDLGELVRESVDGMQRMAPDHRFQLTSPERLPHVWADRTRIQEAVLNFLSNAVKYSPKGSTVRVTGETGEGEVRVSVTDEGPGVDPAERKRLFRKFSRLRPEETAGHGLGLYLTKAIVEAHGGRVWVEGEPGEGSTFGLALPATGRTLGAAPGEAAVGTDAR